MCRGTNRRVQVVSSLACLTKADAHQLRVHDSGLEASDAALQSVEARVDEAFVELDATDARIGKDLQFTDEGLAARHREHFRHDIVKSEWLDLKARVAALPAADLEARHLHLLA